MTCGKWQKEWIHEKFKSTKLYQLTHGTCRTKKKGSEFPIWQNILRGGKWEEAIWSCESEVPADLWLSWEKGREVQKGPKPEVADRFEVGIQVAKTIHALLVPFCPWSSWLSVRTHLGFSLGLQEKTQAKLPSSPSSYRHWPPAEQAVPSLTFKLGTFVLYWCGKKGGFRAYHSKYSIAVCWLGWLNSSHWAAFEDKLTESFQKKLYIWLWPRPALSIKRMSFLPKESLSTVSGAPNITSPTLHWVLSLPNFPKQPAL